MGMGIDLGIEEGRMGGKVSTPYFGSAQTMLPASPFPLPSLPSSPFFTYQQPFQPRQDATLSQRIGY